MGNICVKQLDVGQKYSEFCPLRIASLYADIDESINKKKRIDSMIEYFMKPYYGYDLDVLCIQGIRSYRILKEIVTTFKKTIETYNDERREKNEKPIYLEYYPDIEPCNDEEDVYWNTSETEDPSTYYDKLIITRHTILQSADVQLESDKKEIVRNINRQDSGLILNSVDSDESTNLHKYVQIANLNVDGTFISIYNIDLEEDSIGISNHRIRRRQLLELKYIIDRNREMTKNEEARQFAYGDSIFVATNRDIHIVTGMFHINEIKNGNLSTEYNRAITTLNALDTHRWIAHIRKETEQSYTNIRSTKDTFILLLSKNNILNDNLLSTSLKSENIFEEHKLVIIQSIVSKNHVDMNRFTNYPEDAIFMLYRPKIELYSNRIFTHPIYDQRVVKKETYQHSDEAGTESSSATDMSDKNRGTKENVNIPSMKQIPRAVSPVLLRKQLSLNFRNIIPIVDNPDTIVKTSKDVDANVFTPTVISKGILKSDNTVISSSSEEFNEAIDETDNMKNKSSIVPSVISSDSDDDDAIKELKAVMNNHIKVILKRDQRRKS